MTKIQLLLAIVLLQLIPVSLWAQVTEAQQKYTAFEMRSNGKIYVVVAVVLIILFGLLAYLVRLDRKISKFEKENAK